MPSTCGLSLALSSLQSETTLLPRLTYLVSQKCHQIKASEKSILRRHFLRGQCIGLHLTTRSPDSLYKGWYMQLCPDTTLSICATQVTQAWALFVHSILHSPFLFFSSVCHYIPSKYYFPDYDWSPLIPSWMQSTWFQVWFILLSELIIKSS